MGKVDDYVYHIGTETHDLICGFPPMVHNTDSFVLNVNTHEVIKYLKNLEDLFEFSNLNKHHELFSNRNKKVIGKFKIETPENIWIDEFYWFEIKGLFIQLWE